MRGLFDLSVEKPEDTPLIKYVSLGPYLGKAKFQRFERAWREHLESVHGKDFFLNSSTLSRYVVEVSKIDGEDYIEMGVDPNVYLPIAGKQTNCLETEAKHLGRSLEDYVDSMNFILNDSRIYES